MEALALGTRLVGGVDRYLEHSDLWALEDMATNHIQEEVTIGEFADLVSSLYSFIMFTTYVSIGRHPIPMLDFQVWVEEVKDPTRPLGLHQVVEHKFYEKPITNDLDMMEASAIPHCMKMAPLSQEVVWRHQNTEGGGGRQEGDDQEV